jgi:8-oxo-dGTP pyrophosphatase MutT (NUDIX family)
VTVRVPGEVTARQRGDFGCRGALLVAAVVVHDQERERVLLLRRGPADRFAPGAWDLPVGKQEPGEQITATALRELREETSLAVGVGDLRLVHAVHGAWGVQAPNGFLTLVFAAHRWGGEPVNVEPDAHTEVRWHRVGRLPAPLVDGVDRVLDGYLTGASTITLTGW